MTKELLNDIIEWDVTNWSLALEFWEKNTAQELSQTYTMEIGGKRGGLSLWFAQKGGKVFCTDVDSPVDVASKKHDAYKVSDRIDYGSVNALSIPYENKFDIVVIKSVLASLGHHDNKDAQRTAVEQIHKSLKKGGEFMFAENIKGSPVHQFLRRNFVPHGKSVRYTPLEDMMEFVSIFSDFKFMTAGFLGGMGRTESQRQFLGSIDRAIFNKLFSSSHHYFMIGIARK
ncbi:MAG: class I SAM-dependent methyltransferase [Ignavibacteriaceae bacterium]|nr:class I SAM-dependent methyltransferase [Ignavibacteriaceae bacterium]